MTHRRSNIPHPTSKIRDQKSEIRDRRRPSGATLVDVVAAAVVVVGLMALLLPGAEQNEKEARIAQCAANQKQLAEAAHKYAADFEGKFFYHRIYRGRFEGEEDVVEVGMWYDRKRVGRYLDGVPLTRRIEQLHLTDRTTGRQVQDQPVVVDLGLGDGVFVCPSDLNDAARSYDMNFWALSRASDVEIEHKLRTFPHGQFFDSTVDHADRILLFTDAVEEHMTDDDRWVTAGDGIGRARLPGERFAGVLDVQPVYQGHWAAQYFRRYGVLGTPTALDYVRHGENPDRALSEGAVNIAYADAHVALRQHSQLYEEDGTESTLNTLWSPKDEEIELVSGR